jgi:[acyl-carrier-protein] S-malonyltransferase
MSVALVFPGQGSQSLGMMGALAARFPLVATSFAQASTALDLDLWELVSAGPVERLNMTEYTQPAMLAAGVATFRIWRESGGAAPAVVSGHSLGEFTALTCAEALPFEAAVRLVHARGQLMQRAVRPGEGAMAAILGLADDAQVEAICAEAAQGQVVEAVNFNAPAQVVIAGHTAAVERAMQLAAERGAKRTLRLPVSVPAHSSLLRAASSELEHILEQLPVSKPRYRYVSAMDALEHDDPNDIRATLVRQLASPVRWTDTVRALLSHTQTLIECGPGRVLTGLNRRIDRGAQCLALEDPESLTAALSATGAAGG